MVSIKDNQMNCLAWLGFEKGGLMAWEKLISITVGIYNDRLVAKYGNQLD